MSRGQEAGMAEQEATEELERLVGSVDGCFRLMRIYQAAEQAARPADLWRPTPVEPLFRRLAKQADYSDAAIQHYLDHIR